MVATLHHTQTTTPPPSGIKRSGQLGSNLVQQPAATESPHGSNKSSSDTLVPNNSERPNEVNSLDHDLSLDEAQKSQLGNTNISENRIPLAVLDREFSPRDADPYLLNRYLDLQCDSFPGRLLRGAGVARQHSSNGDLDDEWMDISTMVSSLQSPSEKTSHG